MCSSFMYLTLGNGINWLRWSEWVEWVVGGVEMAANMALLLANAKISNKSPVISFSYIEGLFDVSPHYCSYTFCWCSLRIVVAGASRIIQCLDQISHKEYRCAVQDGIRYFNHTQPIANNDQNRRFWAQHFSLPSTPTTKEVDEAAMMADPMTGMPGHRPKGQTAKPDYERFERDLFTGKQI